MPLLRRFLAPLLILGVLLSTPGLAHAPCEAMPGVEAAMHAGGHDDVAPAGCDHEPRQAPAGDEAGAPCLLVLHCGAAMLPTSVALRELPRTRTPRLEAIATLPASLTLAPESPPPRA